MGFSDFEDDIEYEMPSDTKLDDDNCELEFALNHIRGQKKKLLDYIIKSRLPRSEAISKKLTYSDIERDTGISKKSLSEVIKRLIDTGLVNRYQTQNGRMGSVSFIVSEYVIKNYNNGLINEQ